MDPKPKFHQLKYLQSYSVKYGIFTNVLWEKYYNQNAITQKKLVKSTLYLMKNVSFFPKT